MKLLFPHSVLSIEDVLMGKFNQKKFTQSESYVLNFVKQWHSDIPYFEFSTSGSTGEPKKIALSRDQLIYSATSTLNFLFENRQIGVMMLCINPEFIGGTQVVIRAMLANADLIIVPPSANALNSMDAAIDLISMVPIQVQAELNNPHPFNEVNTVLIGGADIDQTIEKELIKLTHTRFYHTYGMTETASHVALRPLGTVLYKPVGDAELMLDERSCLMISGSVTQNKWITTNDIVELTTDGFIWKGRADLVINTGGIKVHPEQVEQRILEAFPYIKIVISSKEDPVFGERVVLFTEAPLLERLKAGAILSKYELPKEEFILKNFPETKSGKLDRQALRKFQK